MLHCTNLSNTPHFQASKTCRTNSFPCPAVLPVNTFKQVHSLVRVHVSHLGCLERLQLRGDGPVRWLTTAISHTAATIAIFSLHPPIAACRWATGSRRERWTVSEKRGRVHRGDKTLWCEIVFAHFYKYAAEPEPEVWSQPPPPLPSLASSPLIHSTRIPPLTIWSHVFKEFIISHAADQ